MAIDLRKNKDALTKALEKVVDTKQNIDWALFGYEGQTPVLKVVETGDGGIEEMADELNSGKMLYGYCRVLDPNTGLSKFVLIHWTGEGVPENLKLKYTSHLRDVQNFLKSIHVTIPARSEDDIDAEDILKRVAKSSGANYNFHKEKAKPEEMPDPVGTQYNRVIPTREINISQRDKFWAQAEKDEVARQTEERSRSMSQRKAQEEERKEREAKETKEREKKISDHMREINKQRQAEKKADEQNKDAEKQKWEQVQRESSIDEEERGHRSDQLRKTRVAEATQLVSSSTSSARDFFKQKSVERPDAGPRGPPPPRKLQHNFGPQRDSNQEGPPRKQPIQLPKAEESEPAPSKPARQVEPEPEPEPEPEYQYEEPEPEPEPAPVPAAPAAAPQTRDLLRQGLPQRQDSDEEQEDQDWEEPPAEEFTFREKRQPSFTEDYSAEQQHAETQSHRVSGTQHFVEEEQAPPEEEEEYNDLAAANTATAVVPELSADQGKCARALYDYQAADDTEITFDPDDIITNIEQIDAGWWQGFGPDGNYGMFPANYVELIN